MILCSNWYVIMFNWFYAFIGVAIGFIVEPVGRAMNHGPSSAPLWASSQLSKLITTIVTLGFIIFSATFGIQWAFIAIVEIVIGVFISSYFSKH